MTPRVRSYGRFVRWPLGIVAVYVVLGAIFAARSEHRGLLTPSGHLDTGFAMLGLAVVAMRVVVLFVLPPVVAYGVTMRLLAGGGERATGEASKD